MSATAAVVHSFIDLRAFAGTASYPDAGANDVFTARRVPLPLPSGPVSVAAVALDRDGVIVETPVDEFLIVLGGRITLGGLTVPAGESAVLPQGTNCRWSASPGTRAIVMGCAGAPGATSIVPIDEAAPLAPSSAPLADLLVGPTPACRNHTDYRSANGEFVCGTWHSTPYHRLSMRYGHYELMHLLAGAVTLVDATGREATFDEGDVFLVEQGAHCSWQSLVNVKKAYAIYRPAA